MDSCKRDFPVCIRLASVLHLHIQITNELKVRNQENFCPVIIGWNFCDLSHDPCQTSGIYRAHGQRCPLLGLYHRWPGQWWGTTLNQLAPRSLTLTVVVLESVAWRGLGTVREPIVVATVTIRLACELAAHSCCIFCALQCKVVFVPIGGGTVPSAVLTCV